MPGLRRLVRAAALAASMAGVSAYGSLPTPEPVNPISEGASPGPVVAGKRLALGRDITGFYRDRGFRPVWIEGTALRPEARKLLALAPTDRQLHAAVRAAASGHPYALTRADLLLTKAYADQALAAGAAPEKNGMLYIDAELKPKPSNLRASLDRLTTPALSSQIDAVATRNPAFDGLRRGLEKYRSRWSSLPQIRVSSADRSSLERRLGVTGGGAVALAIRQFQQVHGLAPTGVADDPTIIALNRGAAYYERLIEANIERARAIPARPTGRYVLVDTASAQLWMIENGRMTDRMRVIVGRRNMQTPVMAGMMRHVVLNPYWNLPPDLIRQRARTALRRGAAAIERERLQVLSDWSDDAKSIDPRRVDWAAVAAGRRYVNLRQRPGPGNMMGAIKFMFPNELGIYLHDTPFLEDFARADRRISSGCVRVQDAARLARWVFRGTPPVPDGSPEQEVELPEPIPVYITYLTALPTADGVVFLPDPYRRDRPQAGVRAQSRRPRQTRTA